MAGLTFDCKLKGLQPLLKKLKDPGVMASAQQHMLRACQIVRDDAAVRAPADTGHLRSSITFELGKDMRSLTGVVGSPLTYAPYMEFGTGRLTDYPGGGKKSHYPPAAALDLWASRHGMGNKAGFIVARAIARRGGLAPRKFMRNAFEAKSSAVQYEMQKVLNDVVAELAK